MKISLSSCLAFLPTSFLGGITEITQIDAQSTHTCAMLDEGDSSSSPASLQSLVASLSRQQHTASSLDGDNKNLPALLAKADAHKGQGNQQLMRAKLLSGDSTACTTCLLDAAAEYALGLQSAAEAREAFKADGIGSSTATAAPTTPPPPHSEVQAGYVSTGRQLRHLELALYLNLAAANLQLREWDAALACCDQVCVSSHTWYAPNPRYLRV
jgi:LAS superfamily LD-carboxypeptidase LdcB